MSDVKASLISVYLLREAPAGLEVLLLQRGDAHRFPGDWQGVHGHIEPGEAAWQAALRELDEETGIDPSDWFRLIRVASFYEPATDAVYLVPGFVALAAPGAVVRLSAEHRPRSGAPCPRPATSSAGPRSATTWTRSSPPPNAGPGRGRSWSAWTSTRCARAGRNAPGLRVGDGG